MVDDRALSDEEEQWQRDAVRQRLEILDAISAALERRVEVMELIASSPSTDEARAHLAVLLGVSELCATAVLDLQWRRFAQLERSRIADERDRLRRQIG
jgi:DNA gyrase/topoisomerase IV subunit A